jgi:hypothetical protein
MREAVLTGLLPSCLILPHVNENVFSVADGTPYRSTTFAFRPERCRREAKLVKTTCRPPGVTEVISVALVMTAEGHQLKRTGSRA